MSMAVEISNYRYIWNDVYVVDQTPGLHNTFFLRSIRFRFFLKRSSTSAAITIVSKLGSRYQFQYQFLKHWGFNLSFNSNRGSLQCSITTTISVVITTEYDFNSDSGSYGVHNAITVTISVAMGAICNFNFNSGSCGVYSSITATISGGSYTQYQFRSRESKNINISFG